MHVQHFMTVNPVRCEPGQSIAECARLMRDRNVGCVVVVERSRVVGIVTDRMLATRAMAEGLGARTPVSRVMVRDVACVSPEDSIFSVCDTMRSAHLARRLPVVGPNKELLGLVSIADVAVIAKDLIDAILAEDIQHSLKQARALTGGKRIVKRIRRPTKMGRLPEFAIPLPMEGPSRAGVVRNPVPRRNRRSRYSGRMLGSQLPIERLSSRAKRPSRSSASARTRAARGRPAARGRRIGGKATRRNPARRRIVTA